MTANEIGQADIRAFEVCDQADPAVVMAWRRAHLESAVLGQPRSRDTRRLWATSDGVVPGPQTTVAKN